MGKSTVLGLLVLGGLAYAISGGEGSKAPTPTSLPTPSQTYRSAEPAWASLGPATGIPDRAQTAPAPSPAPVRSVYTKGQNVPLRAEPTAEAQILERFPEGTDLTELRRRDGGVNVRHFQTGKEGWAKAASLVTQRPLEREERQEKPKPTAVSTGLPDAAIAALLIKASIANYSGSCACPYQSDRAGRSCGRRSAHSKPGGSAPLCFEDDVTLAMIASYRRQNGSREAASR